MATVWLYNNIRYIRGEFMCKIILDEKLNNKLWGCLSCLFDFGRPLTGKPYVDFYNHLQIELGISPRYEISENDYLWGDNEYQSLFYTIYLELTDFEKIKFAEILLNTLYKGAIAGICENIMEVFPDLNVSENILFENVFPITDLWDKVLFKTNESMELINKILLENDIGYELKNFIGLKMTPKFISEFMSEVQKYLGYDSYIVLLKKIDISNCNEIGNAIFELLKDSKFRTVNNEYFNSLNLYKQGIYKDSVNSMTRSLESTIKIICSELGYSYNPRHQLNDLVKTLFSNDFFDFFTKDQNESLKEVLSKGTGFIRNSAASHGDGTIEKIVNEATCKYVLNMTSVYILYLVDIYNMKKNKP